MMSNLWVSVQLGDIADFLNGFAFKSSMFEDSGEYQVLKLGNIKQGNLLLSKAPAFISAELAQEFIKHLPQVGDILITMTGTKFKRDYGFVCLIEEENKHLVNQRVGNIKSSKSLNSNFLSHYLSSEAFKDNFFLGETGGVNQGNVGSTHILKCKIPLPPLAEQKVIADKLDTLLAQVETTKARLERIPNILKTFRQSVLAAAVSGKLTENWRKVNEGTSVEKTIKSIKEARQQVVSGRDKNAKPHLSEEEYNIPITWQWVSLDSISRKITDGTHHTPQYTESGVNFISVKDIRDGKIDFSNTKYISSEEHQELSKRCPVEFGDLLITKSGTIGRTAIVKTEQEFSLFVSVALIKPASDEVNTKFIDIALQKWVNEIDISSRIVGSAIKNLHLRDMKVLAIPFAPKEEQIEIVRRVEELFVFADNIEQKANAALERVNNLTQSILAKAFRGELTADWRAANPELISGKNSAEALLEKIKAEREAISGKKKSKKKAAVRKKA